MIQINELRHGNKVLNNLNEVVTVQQILHSTIVYGSQMKINYEEASIFANNELEFNSRVVDEIQEAEFHELKPIKLNDDILSNLGFRKFKHTNRFINHGTGHLEFEFTEGFLKLLQPTATWVTISYVHQLQNLYFTLAGKEFVPVFDKKNVIQK